LDEAIAEYHTAIHLKPDNANAHNRLGIALNLQGKPDEAIAEYRTAIHLKPDDHSPHENLGKTLMALGKLEAAIAELRASVRLGLGCATAHTELGNALKDQGKIEEAIAEYRTTARLNPNDPGPRVNLGAILGKFKHDYDGAIVELREAIRLKPDAAAAHNNLGTALNGQGTVTDAIVEFREAIRLEPDLAMAHHNLGDRLRDQGNLDEAIREYRLVIRLKSDYPDAHSNLGAILCDRKHDYDGAVAEFRETVRLKPDDAQAHYCLGNALGGQGKLSESVAELREAILRAPDYAEAHCNLGRKLGEQRDYAASLAELRKGHELGSKRPGWGYPSAQWVANAERLAALAERLPAVLRNEDRPKNAAEQLDFAQMAYDGMQFASSARLFANALAADPKLGDDRQAWHRYNAACAAALAAAGQGTDDPRPTDTARATLRQQALDWLTAERDAWAKLLETGKPAARATVVQTLKHWHKDTDLAGVRNAEALGKLPPNEQKVWTALWADVDAMLKRNELQAQVTLVNPAKAQSKPERPAAKPGEARRVKAGDHASHGNTGSVTARAKPTNEVAGDRAAGRPKPDIDKLPNGSEATTALAKRWPAILKGEDRPRDTAERLAFAELAYDRKHFAAAARFWAEALAADPKGGADHEADRLYRAAHAAILAADGKGKDDPPPDEQAKGRLRTQAVDWLKADLASWAEVLEPGLAQDRTGLIRALLQWKTETDLAGVRDPQALKKLPPEEQGLWRTFWASVDIVLKPDDCWAHTHLGEALNAEGKREQAVAEFRSAIRLAPYDGGTCYGMAMAMRDQGHADPAIELLSRAVKWDSEHLDNPGGAVWELGHTLRAAGRFDDAVATYRRIREMN